MRLFKTRSEKKKTLWQRAVDLALTDVRVLAGGMDEETLESLEERLLAADFGVQATLRLVDHVEELARRGKIRRGVELREALQDEIREILAASADPELTTADSGPTVYLVVGVNGVGKTTTVAKLAHRLQQTGYSVLMAAADTYRAGAIEQLANWSERVGTAFVGGSPGGDPAAVAFDALGAAESRGIEFVLIDTAGRLHTHSDLMSELEKVDRVVRRRLEGAPHETLLVLDATVGQNAVAQARAFRSAVSPTGLVMAKMDSSARGGIVVGLQEEFGIPVKLVGTGEGFDDLEEFDADAFVAGVFSEA